MRSRSNDREEDYLEEGKHNRGADGTEKSWGGKGSSLFALHQAQRKHDLALDKATHANQTVMARARRIPNLPKYGHRSSGSGNVRLQR